MSVLYTTVVGTTTYGFDWVNQQITVDSATTSISAADLKTAIHDAQDDGATGIAFPIIATFGNPLVLTPTSSTFLNVVLLDQWRILSLATSGTFTVGEGNVVNTNNGIDIFANNPLVTTNNSTSAAGVLVSSPSSVVTPSQQEIRDAMKLAPSTGTPVSGSIDKQLDDIDNHTSLDLNLTY